MNVVFAKTRYHYDSYSDFWRLVELSGFNTCYVDEIDLKNECAYITTPINGELKPHVLYRRSILSGPQFAKIIWWKLERPDATAMDPKEMLRSTYDEAMEFVDEAWISDGLLQSMEPRYKLVPVGSHPGLAGSWEDKERPQPLFDFTHQSYSWGRREVIYNQLIGQGLKEGRSCYGPPREHVLAHSSLMLNLQQYLLPVVAPIRFALAAAYKMPLVTEQVADSHPLVRHVDFWEAPYDQIVRLVVDCCADTVFQATSKSLHERLCHQYTFRRCVESALSH